MRWKESRPSCKSGHPNGKAADLLFIGGAANRIFQPAGHSIPTHEQLMGNHTFFENRGRLVSFLFHLHRVGEPPL